MPIAVPWPLPALRGAWPTGEHDRLIKAAILADEDRALAEAFAWLNANDLDAASFRDHRLLIAIMARFGRRLEDHPYYPRLAGLQRMLWTRTLMFLRDARPALTAIAGKGIGILLIKGAARLADGGAGKSGRIAHDLDIVVRPEDMLSAFDTLADDGWTPSTGASNLRIRREIGALRAINMYKGRHGDIDLHSHAYHPGQGTSEDDRMLWGQATPTELDGISVLVPPSEERIALSIAHGGLDAHNHSDWLIDIAAILRSAPISFDRLEDIIDRRGIATPAAIALSYLSNECGLEIDEGFLARIARRARRDPLRYLSGYLQARPRDRESAAGSALRWIAKSQRGRTSRRAVAGQRSEELSVRRFRTDVSAAAGKPLVKKVDLDLGDGVGPVLFEAQIAVPVPPKRRRVEFELNAPGEHLAHGGFRCWGGEGEVCLSIGFALPPSVDASTVTLEARPRRANRVIATPADEQRYGALPFRVIDMKFVKRPD